MGDWRSMHEAQRANHNAACDFGRQQQQMNALDEIYRRQRDAAAAQREPVQVTIRDVTDEKPPVLLLPPGRDDEK